MFERVMSNDDKWLMNIVEGKLSKFDDRFNVILTDAVEHIRDLNDKTIITQQDRKLGEVFVKGTSIVDITLKDGFVKIE